MSVTNTAQGVDPGPFEYDISTVLFGATAGYNLQFGNVVLGLEGDLSYVSPDGQGYIPSADPAHHQDLTLGAGVYSNVTGRLGYAVEDTLFYAKGGIAFFGGEALQATTKDGYDPTGTDVFAGLTIGAGIEHFFGDNFSVKAEYQHVDFGTAEAYQTSTIADPPTPIGTRFYNYTDLSFDTVKIGLNYHF